MTRRRNQSGFTLSEILVALVLAGMVSVAILMLARGQLRAHEMNDEIMRAQSNVRAGIGYVESILRRSCGGTSSGAIGINVGTPTPQTITTCVRAYDGASVSAGTFTNGSVSAGTSNPDAIEIIYPISSPTVATTDTVLTTAPSVAVANISGFVAGSDLVLVSDNSGADLFRLQTITPTGATSGPGTLTMYPVGTAASSFTPTGVTLPAGSSVFRATSVALFLDTTSGYTAPTGYQRTLLLDPDGIAGNVHTDAEPLVENVDDLQIAFGVDGYNGGTIDGLVPDNLAANSDEWVGNYTAELTSMSTSVPTPWVSTGIHPIAVRVTLLVRTSDKYVGTAPTLAYEDRNSYPTVKPGTPRYRAERIVVAPRAWNLGN
jgi:prepilin-type N-terminal cleavage/methylation domain-containing protein